MNFNTEESIVAGRAARSTKRYKARRALAAKKAWLAEYMEHVHKLEVQDAMIKRDWEKAEEDFKKMMSMDMSGGGNRRTKRTTHRKMRKSLIRRRR